MKILVLGSTGLIGGHIVKAALSSGWQVRAFRRNPEITGNLGEAPVEWVAGNLDDPVSIEAAMADIDIVFHAAAFAPKSDNPELVPAQIAEAREQTRRVIAAVRKQKVKRLIFTSTLSTIGPVPTGENRLADERDVYQLGTFPKNGYYECKTAMEEEILQAVEEGLDAVITNPTAVFGPGDFHLSMGHVLLMVARGQAMAWLPGDTNAIDVRDVALAHIAAAEKGRRGERYILGGHNLTVREALTETARIAGVKPPRFGIPLWLIQGIIKSSDAVPFIPSPSNHLRALPYWQGYNTQKARNELGLSPRPFSETVKDALDWFKANNYF